MKRRFEFRLARVQRVRELEERVARSERVQAEGLARAAEARRDEARSVLAQSRAHLHAILSGNFDPRAVLSYQRMLDGELTSLRRRVESARTQRTQAERMAALHRERKSAARALEELRERARLRHGAELEKHENAVLDEVAQRVARAKGESASRSAPPASDQGNGPALGPAP